LTLEQAAVLLGTSKMTVLRMISTGAISASQACKSAPWVIKRSDLQRADGRVAGQAAGFSPLPNDPKQISLQLQ
jgi:excisionase family DNA binding protein